MNEKTSYSGSELFQGIHVCDDQLFAGMGEENALFFKSGQNANHGFLCHGNHMRNFLSGKLDPDIDAFGFLLAEFFGKPQ